MKRREFLKHITYTSAGIVVSPYIFNSCSPKKRMNILFIMADDHAYRAISSYGSGLNNTPNIDRLAKEGVLFEKSFVTNSICGPSRACMLTGKYNHLNGMIDNFTTFDGTQQTFTKILQENGYQTALIGKWHLKSEPTGFDYWKILPGQGNYYNPDFIEMGEKKRVEGYVTDLITDFSFDWLDQRDKSKPFCLLLHHKAPHRNWMPKEEYLNQYDEENIPIPSTFFDDYSNRGEAAKSQEMSILKDMSFDYDLKVPFEKDEENNYKDQKTNVGWQEDIYERLTDEQKKKFKSAYEEENEKFKSANLNEKELAEWKYQRYIKDYLRCISSVDENIGRVLDYLDENNLSENTVVVYTSDQGFYLGEHGWFDKRFMYEESFRTPLIIRSPESLKNYVDKENLVVNIDYAPTLLDYADVPIPSDMQGKSLRKIISGNSPDNWRNEVYYHYYEYPAEHQVKRHYGIRTTKYKLIHFYYDIDEWELYDLENDPHELNNLYHEDSYKHTIAKLKNDLQKLREEYDDNDLKKFLPKPNIQISHKGIGGKVTFENKYADKYSGGNHNTLVDGWRGPNEYISRVDYSVWQGFEKNDLEATIDFNDKIEIQNITAGFLHFLESWIFIPEFVEIQYQVESKNYNSLGKVFSKTNVKETRIVREEINFTFDPVKTNSIKIFAKNVAVCPDWHKGSGQPAWLFADEIIFK